MALFCVATVDSVRWMNAKGVAVKTRVLDNGNLFGVEYEAGEVSFADTCRERDC